MTNRIRPHNVRQNTTQKTKDSEIFQERFEDIKNEIRSRRSKKDKQHNGQKKKMKRQTTVKKTKD